MILLPDLKKPGQKERRCTVMGWECAAPRPWDHLHERVLMRTPDGKMRCHIVKNSRLKKVD